MDSQSGMGALCRVCGGNAASAKYEAREMMFGIGARFQYAECSACASLSLLDPPGDYGAYYPNGYYSFSNGNETLKGRVKDYLRGKRDNSYFRSRDLVGRFLARRYEDGPLLSVSKLGVGRDARILDVGCGSGNLLHRMAAVGFKNLAGVDPFLSDEMARKNGIWIRKCRLEDLEKEKYEAVMFHHSLEHIAEPTRTLRMAAELLTPSGICLIRLPVVAYAWEEYKANWVQLDPPRHMWLPTAKGMNALANSAGFVVERVSYDSTEFQFWGSELCLRGLPFNGVMQRDLGALFRREEIERFRKQAASLNRKGRGDQAAFFLRRAEH
jgi:SAM-dependent methyltransferase